MILKQELLTRPCHFLSLLPWHWSPNPSRSTPNATTSLTSSLETVGTRLDVFRISKSGEPVCCLDPGTWFPRVEPGVSLVQRQPHASPFPQEHYPRGFEEVIRWTEQYSEPDSTSAASGTRKLRPLQDYFKIADEEGVLSAGRGVPSAGELGHLMKGNDREGGRALTSLSSTRLLWAHRLKDNIKHAVETRLESAAVPPLEAVEQLSELEKKKENHFEQPGVVGG